MAGGIDWFRWHHGTVTDQKFPLIAKRAGASVAEAVAVWACLLESASMNNKERGLLDAAPDFEAMDCALGLADGLAHSIFTAMCDRGLLDEGLQVTAWQRRQPKREREDDASTARVQAFRDRKRHETPSNAKDAQETPRGEESREEIKKEIKKESARGSRLPEHFEPDFQFAVEQGIQNTLEEAAKFRDYWRAQPGQKGVKTDWPATWRNWCRNAIKPSAKTMTFRERDAANAAARVHEMTGGLVSAKPIPITRHNDALQEIFDARDTALKLG